MKTNKITLDDIRKELSIPKELMDALKSDDAHRVMKYRVYDNYNYVYALSSYYFLSDTLVQEREHIVSILEPLIKNKEVLKIMLHACTNCNDFNYSKRAIKCLTNENKKLKEVELITRLEEVKQQIDDIGLDGYIEFLIKKKRKYKLKATDDVSDALIQFEEDPKYGAISLARICSISHKKNKVYQNDLLALKLYELAASMKHPNANYWIAMLYENGKLGKRDNEKAFIFLEKSLIDKSEMGIDRLYEYHHEGIVVDKSFENSIKVYEKAVELGMYKYCIKIHDLYNNDNTIDIKKQKYWIEKAFELNYLPAEYYKYEAGEVIKKDSVELNGIKYKFEDLKIESNTEIFKVIEKQELVNEYLRKVNSNACYLFEKGKDYLLNEIKSVFPKLYNELQKNCSDLLLFVLKNEGDIFREENYIIELGVIHANRIIYFDCEYLQFIDNSDKRMKFLNKDIDKYINPILAKLYFNFNLIQVSDNIDLDYYSKFNKYSSSMHYTCNFNSTLFEYATFIDMFDTKISVRKNKKESEFYYHPEITYDGSGGIKIDNP
ncbi:MAG: sel1 repeat family protein [Saccharospirillaceae bacterium]|nr:sel1 repeat family protein [Pseudomonadales bacterium]NRB80330.1 sel1 repeat family protein [Saccharospirillaceae bacterium]